MMKRLLAFSGAVFCLTQFAGVAHADPFVVRTSRPNYAESTVGRPVTIAKEWAEFGLSYEMRDVTQFTDDAGKTHPTDYKYRYSWLMLGMRYGFTRNLTLILDVPYDAGTTRTGGSDGNPAIHSHGLGDVRFGFQWQFLSREKGSNLTSLGLQVDTKQPSGNESPGEIGNRRIPLGTGTTNAGVALLAKQRLGPIAASANVGYVHKFSAVAQWVRDFDGPAGLNGRIKPGDEIDAGLHLMVQPIAFAGVEGGVDYISRADALVGHTANELNPAADLKTFPCTAIGGFKSCSNFTAVNATARVIVEPSVNWTFSGGVRVPVQSRNSAYFFPLEDLSQSYGTTILASAAFRW